MCPEKDGTQKGRMLMNLIMQTIQIVSLVFLVLRISVSSTSVIQMIRNNTLEMKIVASNNVPEVLFTQKDYFPT